MNLEEKQRTVANELLTKWQGQGILPLSTFHFPFQVSGFRFQVSGFAFFS